MVNRYVASALMLASGCIQEPDWTGGEALDDVSARMLYEANERALAKAREMQGSLVEVVEQQHGSALPERTPLIGERRRISTGEALLLYEERIIPFLESRVFRGPDANVYEMPSLDETHPEGEFGVPSHEFYDVEGALRAGPRTHGLDAGRGHLDLTNAEYADAVATLPLWVPSETVGRLHEDARAYREPQLWTVVTLFDEAGHGTGLRHQKEGADTINLVEETIKGSFYETFNQTGSFYGEH